jgi:hypothetical protein
VKTPASGAIASPGATIELTGSEQTSEVSVLQAISILGALAVLAAFAANQLGWMRPSQLSYALANFAGSAILTAVAIVDQQIGFVLLQGAWALVSLVGIVTILRGARARGPG